MFDIGFLELLVIAVLGLLIMGPERLPGAIRTATLWIGRIRRSFNDIKAEIEREVGADEIRQQLHNEGVMKNLEREAEQLKDQVENRIDPIRRELSEVERQLTDDASSEHNDTSNKA